MLEFQLGSVICELCGCLYAYLYVVLLCACLDILCDGILIFSHMMVGIGERPS